MNRKTRKWLYPILFLLLAAMLAVPTSASAASKIKMSRSAVAMSKGKTYRLKVSGTRKKAVWRSSNQSVATVSQSGIVKARKSGTAVITAKVAGKSLRCRVIVKQPVTKIRLNQKSISISKGKTYTLRATVTPTNATNRAVTWKSSNKKVVTVTSKGKIKAVGAGKATITATAKDGSRKKATCKITVKKSSSDAGSAKLSDTKLTLQVGEKEKLTVSNAGGVRVAWGSSDKSVAVVSGGTITAKKAGTAVIAARLMDGSQTLFCNVKVAEKSAASRPDQNELPVKPSGASANAKRFLSILQKYSDQVKSDRAAGIQWKYSNSSSLAPSTFAKAKQNAETKGVAYCNCALLPRWALREMGVINSKNFWGTVGGGITFRGDVKAQLEKKCDIIKVYKTPKQLLAEGNLLPGDICSWVEYQHTNVYAGDGLWYDSGRGVNYQSSTGTFTSFGPAAAVNMSGTTVGYIIRFR